MSEKSITVNSSRKLTKAQRRELEELARMPDSKIDLSDIPEMKLDHAIPFRQRPRTVTTQIDNDLLEWLKREDKDIAKPLNRMLRLVMEQPQHVGRRRRSVA